MVTISQTESRTINALRFICLLCVVMIHCAAHAQPEAVAGVSSEVYQTAKQCHAFYTSLPCLQILFILSGYLFFRNVSDSWNRHRDYLGKLKSRLVSLCLPYLICRVCKHLTPLLCVAAILSPLPFDFVYINAYLLLGAYFAYSGITLTGIGRLFPWKTALILAIVCSGLAIFLPLPISFKSLNIILLAIWLPALLGATEGLGLPSICSPAAGMFLYASLFYVCIFIGVRCVRNLPLNLLMLNVDMWLSFIGATVLLLALFVPLSRYPRLIFLLTGGRTTS